MPALHEKLRKQLEKTVIEARDIAEDAATEALKRLAVDQPKLFDHMTPDERELRNKLRAKARQLGGRRDKAGRQAIDHLVTECAYEHWHRMLFARFLAENHLLIHEEMAVPVSLEECEELAKEEGTDGWTLAARFASRMLPQIFRRDDPVLAVTLAPESKRALEKMLDTPPPDVFTADDSLGWVYQFWQDKRKDEVNASGVKIGADELPAVTQLFTEHYMVLFLLHNTLGAWWAGKVLGDQAANQSRDRKGADKEEDAWRKLLALPGCDFDYLRFSPDGKPAAGTFSGWPTDAKDLKILDPCCGSGHFLVAAFDLMVRVRMKEEGLPPRDACDAVLRDNVFGLEIDPRCTQIAAFALALAAWRFPEAGGYRELPELHIACCGIGPNATEEQWLELTEQSGVPMPTLGREPIKNGLLNLHELFSKAPTLGSLIDPNQLPADLIAADYETLQPYLAAALAAEHAADETHERAVAAAGMVKAAELLAGEYSLVITNVPYLGRGKQHDMLKEHMEKHYKDGKADLATAFVLRCLEFCAADGSTALVTPQNWLFLTSYKKLRTALLKQRTWQFVARLGAGAFETIGGHVVNVALLAVSATPPASDALMAGIDVSSARQPDKKAALLRGLPVDPPGIPPTAGEAHPTERLAPAKERMAPATERTVPAAEPMTPAKERAAPAEERTVPAKEWTAPAEEWTAPAEERMIRSPAAEGPRMAEKATGRPGNDVSPPQDDPADAGEATSPQTDSPAADGPAHGSIKLVPQAEQLKNPDARVVFTLSGGDFLKLAADSRYGLRTGDGARLILKYWELDPTATLGKSALWRFQQSCVDRITEWGGKESVFRWNDGGDPLATYFELGIASMQGMDAWGKDGIVVSLMSDLPVALYAGEAFDNNCGVIWPNRAADLPAVWAFCSSPLFAPAVRRIDQSLKVTNQTLLKVPFDLAHWQKVAAEKYPDGLPEPESDDPTQWLFHGRPEESTAPLQVAVARLLGYRWPAELDATMRLSKQARGLVQRCEELLRFADDDGIVCIPAVGGEQTAADRVRAVLAAAYSTGGDAGATWSPAKQEELLTSLGYGGKSIGQWLGDGFFEQHYKLFHHRPFIWHVWDGRKKDGFGALVNYHMLDAKLLDRLIYTYLGDWIKRQEQAVAHDESGADARLLAAQQLQEKLKLIAEGEPPYDIFVRWKPIEEQAIGWNPDLNDGVRMNIRPFMEADILRKKPNCKWKKDRGKEPQRSREQYPWFYDDNGEPTGDRVNDVHLTNAEKLAARKRAEQGASC